MNKDNLNVGDGKGMEEDLKEMDKKKPKEEEMGSLKVKRKPPKELMKGGIRDRPLLSWIRILVVTAIWWACIFGFLVGCFSLMYAILYGSDEGSKAPYFVRNANKYPDLLPHPGIKIDCAEQSCIISLNRIIGWTPQPWDAAAESPSQELKDERPLVMKTQLKKMGRSEKELKEVAVVVTCYGATADDELHLTGMKQNKAGFPKEAFPWTGESETKEDERRSLILDLSQTNAMLELPNSKAMLYCQAWAKNIDTERSFVDKGRPNGGGSCHLDFKDKKVKCLKKNDE